MQKTVGKKYPDGLLSVHWIDTDPMMLQELSKSVLQKNNQIKRVENF